MDIKREILSLIKNYNQGRAVGFPIIDRTMLKKDLYGGKLKKVIDLYVEEGLLTWESTLSLKITNKGIKFLDNP